MGDWRAWFSGFLAGMAAGILATNLAMWLRGVRWP